MLLFLIFYEIFWGLFFRDCRAPQTLQLSIAWICSSPNFKEKQAKFSFLNLVFGEKIDKEKIHKGRSEEQQPKRQTQRTRTTREIVSRLIYSGRKHKRQPNQLNTIFAFISLFQIFNYSSKYSIQRCLVPHKRPTFSQK